MKIAFVTPWYGHNVPGGAESETRRTAEHLHEAGFAVEVLTTCIRDFYADWGRNHHKPGVEMVNGIAVRRFPVQKRDKVAFDRVNQQLMQGRRVSAEEERIYIEEMIRCPDLYAHIEENCRDHLLIFIPYMFATTFYGAQIYPQRTAVIPCFHDESYIYMDIYKQVFPQVHTLILHVEAEHRLVEKVFGAANGQFRAVIGEGVDADFTVDAERFRQKYGLDQPFLLYVGRKIAGKNIPLLVDYWSRYTQVNDTDMKLVLIGKGEVAIPPEASQHVVDLGFVPLQDKYDAYAAADIFCLPSVNESFSLVTMESWLAETPVLVNGRCEVTQEHCQRSNGGLYFSNYDEFAATVDYLVAHPDIARQMGRNGRRYVLENYQWPTIVEKYAHLLANMQSEPLPHV